MNVDKIILSITPQTWVKVLPNEKIFFRIPEVCTRGDDEGGSCDEYIATGLCKHTLYKSGRYRKRRIEKYNQYKVDVLHLAKKAAFALPTNGFAVYFYFPMPKYWSQKRRAVMKGQMKLSKPDIDNLRKPIFDSLSITDECVGQMSGDGKFWIDQPQGYIEILLNQPVYNPFGVEFIDQRIVMKQPKRKYILDPTKQHKKRGRKTNSERELLKKENRLI